MMPVGHFSRWVFSLCFSFLFAAFLFVSFFFVLHSVYVWDSSRSRELEPHILQEKTAENNECLQMSADILSKANGKSESNSNSDWPNFTLTQAQMHKDKSPAKFNSDSDSDSDSDSNSNSDSEIISSTLQSLSSYKIPSSLLSDTELPASTLSRKPAAETNFVTSAISQMSNFLSWPFSDIPTLSDFHDPNIGFRLSQSLTLTGTAESGSAPAVNQFHIFWEPMSSCSCPSCDYKLLILIRSFVATQNLKKSQLNLWYNPASASPQAWYEFFHSPILQEALNYVSFRIYDPNVLSKGTPIEGSSVLQAVDVRAYLQSDLARILILYKYGGIYIDTDNIFLNDFDAIVQYIHSDNFIARWSCTEQLAVGLIAFLKSNSPFLHHLLTQIAEMTGKQKKEGYSWGRELYTKVYNERKMSEQTKKDIPVLLPACLFYPEWCTEGFHDYQNSKSSTRPLFLQTFAYHWHGAGGFRYGLPIEPGSQFQRTTDLVESALKMKFKSDDALESFLSNGKFDPRKGQGICFQYLTKRFSRTTQISVGIIMAVTAAMFYLSAMGYLSVTHYIRILLKPSTLAILLYVTVSISITLANKAVFAVYRFPYPLLMILSQLIVSCLLTQLFSFLRLIHLEPISNHFPTLKSHTLLSLSFVIMTTCGLAALKYLTIPMYNCLRQLSTVFTIAVDRIYFQTVRSNGLQTHSQTQSFALNSSLTAIVIGAVLAGFDDPMFTLAGYSLTILACIATTVYLSLIKLTAQKNIDPMNLLWINSLLSLPQVFFVCSLSGELTSGLSAFSESMADKSFVFVFLCQAIMAFLLNYSIFLCTQLNSPLDTSLAGTLKNILTTVIGAIAFGDVTFSTINFIGILITLAASTIYVITNMQQAANNANVNGNANANVNANTKADATPQPSPLSTPAPSILLQADSDADAPLITAVADAHSRKLSVKVLVKDAEDMRGSRMETYGEEDVEMAVQEKQRLLHRA